MNACAWNWHDKPSTHNSPDESGPHSLGGSEASDEGLPSHLLANGPFETASAMVGALHLPRVACKEPHNRIGASGIWRSHLCARQTTPSSPATRCVASPSPCTARTPSHDTCGIWRTVSGLVASSLPSWKASNSN